jgi:uncharacterized membrane protein (UPF0127 family)
MKTKMKNKQNLIIVSFAICLILLSITIFTYYITNEENQTQEKIAIVTFFPSNATSLSITCEIASTPQKRSEGLMNRAELPDDKGMLFVYETPQNLSFWMKNTLIPLDIIFLDETRVVINIESADIEPDVSDKDLKRYNSTSPAQFVVEINQGLSTLYGIDEGTPTFIEYI